MKNTKLQIGFWHPFGQHAGEKADKIIERKKHEISQNGWTLWSFSYKTPATLETWFKEIKNIKPKKVLVFCSDGKGTKNPVSKTKYCDYFTLVGKTNQEQIPSLIKIPHPMGTKTKASAFVVKKVIYPVAYESIPLDWFYVGKKKWQNHRSSTFGEHLIKAGKGKPIGNFCAVLELKYPYLAEIGVTK